ncbi:MAG TPA: hypothetical protein VLL52_18925 [Anaerolineae bacterium]|nr:hypothetical protein [Anaerolineae bacterium]
MSNGPRPPSSNLSHTLPSASTPSLPILRLRVPPILPLHNEHPFCYNKINAYPYPTNQN